MYKASMASGWIWDLGFVLSFLFLFLLLFLFVSGTCDIGPSHKIISKEAFREFSISGERVESGDGEEGEHMYICVKCSSIARFTGKRREASKQALPCTEQSGCVFFLSSNSPHISISVCVLHLHLHISLFSIGRCSLSAAKVSLSHLTASSLSSRCISALPTLGPEAS